MDKKLSKGKLNTILEIVQLSIILCYIIFDGFLQNDILNLVFHMLFLGLLFFAVIAERFMKKQNFWIVSLVGALLGVLVVLFNIERLVYMVHGVAFYAFIGIIYILLLLSIIALGIAITILHFKPVKTKSDRIVELETRIKELENATKEEKNNQEKS